MQGDILRRLEIRDSYKTTSDITFDFLVVLTQDCDLAQDIAAIDLLKTTEADNYVQPKDKKAPNHDKFLNSILVCPAFIAEQLRNGFHLLGTGWTMEHIASEKWKMVKINECPRYHYLEEDASLGVPALAMDFKRFYTVPKGYIESVMSNKVARLDELYAHDVSQRFASYLSRVALP